MICHFEGVSDVELIREIAAMKKEVERWKTLFDEATERGAIDYYFLHLKASQDRLDSLYLEAKQQAVTGSVAYA